MFFFHETGKTRTNEINLRRAYVNIHDDFGFVWGGKSFVFFPRTRQFFMRGYIYLIQGWTKLI